MTGSNYSTIGSAIREMARVIHALILREMRTRFGRQRRACGREHQRCHPGAGHGGRDPR